MWCFVLLMLEFASAAKDFAPPRLSVSLDDPPEHRWDAAVTQFNSSIHESLKILYKNPLYAAGLDAAQVLLKHDQAAVRAWYPGEQWSEVQGISRVSGVDVWKLAAITTIYDLTAGSHADSKACTSIVAENSKGEIVHGRNLDYSLREAMQNLTAIVDFKRGGKTAFTAVTYIFMTGFNTAVKPGVLSLTQDERDQGSQLYNWVDLFLQRRHSTFGTIRQVVDASSTFEGAIKALSTVELPADSYFILGGVRHGEGAVVTRNRNASGVDVWRLGDNKGKRNWYVLETNYDHWKQPSSHDDRRAAAQRFMDAHGPTGFEADTMWAAVSNKQHNASAGERPVYNTDTVYSIVVQASHPEGMKVMVRGAYD